MFLIPFFREKVLAAVTARAPSRWAATLHTGEEEEEEEEQELVAVRG